MSSQRTAHDPEHDVLRGSTVHECRQEAARLAAKALAITDHLAFARYSAQSMVRQNLERERDALEWSSHGISSRIAEHEGKVLRVREAGPVPTARALLVQRRARQAV